MSNEIPGTPHPAPPKNQTGSSDYNYPETEDQKIRDIADLVGDNGIIALLDRLRVFALGDLGKTIRLADDFSRKRNFLDAVDLIGSTQLSLNAVWQGDAYGQFDKYAGFAAATLKTSQDSIVKLTTTMTNVAKAVLDTYKTLLGFIGNCAANLSTVAGKVAIAVGTVWIPVLDVLTSKEVLDTVNSAFAAFWRDCTAAMTAMITNVGNLVGAGLEFSTIETNFPKIPPAGSSAKVIDDPSRWRIKPGADHS